MLFGYVACAVICSPFLNHVSKYPVNKIIVDIINGSKFLIIYFTISHSQLPLLISATHRLF